MLMEIEYFVAREAHKSSSFAFNSFRCPALCNSSNLS